VVSPAEALRGHYHESDVTPTGFKGQQDYVVRTDCLRTGDRCMSFFHAPPASAMALVFGAGEWVYDREFDGRCSKGGTAHVRIVAHFPMPQPAQDPIALLTGHGHEDVTNSGGTNCGSTDVDAKFARTGD
jgi:serine/threonine-protein kinase